MKTAWQTKITYKEVLQNCFCRLWKFLSLSLSSLKIANSWFCWKLKKKHSFCLPGGEEFSTGITITSRKSPDLRGHWLDLCGQSILVASERKIRQTEDLPFSSKTTNWLARIFLLCPPSALLWVPWDHWPTACQSTHFFWVEQILTYIYGFQKLGSCPEFATHSNEAEIISVVNLETL